MAANAIIPPVQLNQMWQDKHLVAWYLHDLTAEQRDDLAYHYWRWLNRRDVTLTQVQSSFEATLWLTDPTHPEYQPRRPQALAAQAGHLAEQHPDDASHYQRARTYLLADQVDISTSGQHLYFIRRAGGSQHNVYLDYHTDRRGIRRHSCTCANPTVCWARVLADTLAAWRAQGVAA